MRYQLAGFVRNTHDGKVEVFAQGSPNDIDGFLRDIQETFNVRDTNIQEAPVSAQYDGFNIAF